MSEALTQAQQLLDEKVRGKILAEFKPGDDISVPLIQRKCKTGYFSSYRVFEQLKREKKVKPGENANGISKFV